MSREQTRRDAEIPSRDECLAWMDKYSATSWANLALATSSAHDPSPLRVMAGLRFAVEQAERELRTQGHANARLAGERDEANGRALKAAARLEPVPALVEALRKSCEVIEGLADQQAMADDWYEKPLAEARDALARYEQSLGSG